MKNSDITFRIDAFTPETLPMARLAEYLSLLAALYGNKEHVHFSAVESGSALLKVEVEEEFFPKVLDRIGTINAGEPNKEVAKAYQQIDDLLRHDKATGELRAQGKVIFFPGRNKRIEETIFVNQWTQIDGVVIKIGGKDSSIPVTIRDLEGATYNCQIYGEDRARELAKHYLGSLLRIRGDAKFARHPQTGWTIQSLVIEDFEVIAIRDLTDIFTDLRNVPNNGWAEEPNPVGSWKVLRGH